MLTKMRCWLRENTRWVSMMVLKDRDQRNASMTDRQSVAANATVQNVYAGNLNEFLQATSLVNLYASAAAVGLNCSLIVGDEIFLDDQEVSAQNRMPLVPDDLVVQAAGFQGDRVIVRYRNTTGAAIVAFSRVDMLPKG